MRRRFRREDALVVADSRGRFVDPATGRHATGPARPEALWISEKLRDALPKWVEVEVKRRSDGYEVEISPRLERVLETTLRLTEELESALGERVEVEVSLAVAGLRARVSATRARRELDLDVWAERVERALDGEFSARRSRGGSLRVLPRGEG